jgi:hypothetical protein
MAEPRLTLTTVIAVAPDQVSSDLAGEAVILNLKDGTYYGLNEVGARIWSLIQQPQTIGAVRDALMAEYTVDAERCERDLLTLLNAMAARGLIEVHHAARTPFPSPAQR